MKKIYEKPQILFEDFTLTTNIAAGCETKTTTPSWNQCAYPVKFGREEKNFFLSTISACTTTEDDGEYEGFCYHTPTEANNLFNS